MTGLFSAVNAVKHGRLNDILRHSATPLTDFSTFREAVDEIWDVGGQSLVGNQGAYGELKTDDFIASRSYRVGYSEFACNLHWFSKSDPAVRPDSGQDSGCSRQSIYKCDILCLIIMGDESGVPRGG